MKPDRTIDPALLPALAAFACVARHASFRQAALELGVSPSALSQTIRNLERRLGTRLLQRTTRTVGLTEPGQRLLQETVPALARIGTALQAMEESRDIPSGQLRITTPRYAAEHLLLPFLPGFHARHPQVRVELSIQPAMVDVVAEGFDAGIRLGESLAAGMIAVPLGPSLRLAVVASPDYLQQHGVPDRPEALVDHACIPHRNSDGRIMPWEFSRDGHDFYIEVDGPLLLNDSHLALQATRAGLGLQQVFEHNVRADLDAGRLVRVLEAWQVPFAGFHLYYPSRDQLAPKLRVFIDFMRAANAR
ncbi:LysR family transcriptional regulator [Stenotrophomonas sp. SY1]|uniref:LysR family transcriptional regulator n=1 Tax=Stenotrophomonas sp. SY1 TaxID=477235 RepID=UPI001E33E493|nr:LysR family transcriptional regulator [Stenotrophomonas sp. SY1]MCD9088335.1 LysR family transcriptional regulator [Stenotrophomonas sp. SY1]